MEYRSLKKGTELSARRKGNGRTWIDLIDVSERFGLDRLAGLSSYRGIIAITKISYILNDGFVLAIM